MRQRIRNILLEAISFKDRLNINDAFWKWFADSKVVDKNGDPIVVYHGTKDGRFQIFSFDKRGSNTYHKPSEVGFHFTSEELDARVYAGGRIQQNFPHSEIKMVFLRMINPFIKRNSAFNPEDIKLAKEDGYDGIIAPSGFGSNKEYVVFSPTQIKSIFNQGTWNPNDPDIMK